MARTPKGNLRGHRSAILLMLQVIRNGGSS